jgi:large subunit ribosomal protein L35
VPKLKTKKTAAKRFSISATGKVLRSKGHKSHLRRRKSKAARRAFNQGIPLHATDASRMKKLLPYGTT